MRLYYSILIIFILAVSYSCKKDDHESMPGMGVKSDSTTENHSEMLTLDNEKQMLINIAFDTVRFTVINAQTTLTGTISADENKLTTISARVKGRIDRLFVRQEGEHVVNGQSLYSIYSEELLADQNDYLAALQQHDKFPGQQSTVDALIHGGRKKLLLWGMTEKQIKNLESSQQASALLTYYSGYTGFVAKLWINEGEYTEIGKPLFQIADLSSVWVETQVYTNEINYFNERTEAFISIEAFPQKIFKAKVVFENPAMEENSKINLLRFRIENKDNMIKTGMMARVTINHHPKQTLVIPKKALLIGRMTMVWIEAMPGMFESRTVETGIENNKFVEIISGLKEGDRVVVSGAYLLNSEFILKQGANSSMGGMKM